MSYNYWTGQCQASPEGKEDGGPWGMQAACISQQRANSADDSRSESTTNPVGQQMKRQ